MFENKIIKGVHASRFIMSWVRGGGVFGHLHQGYGDFEDWLRSLGLDDDEEVDCILEIAQNGKLELETSAKNFIKNNVKPRNSNERA